MDLIQSVGQYVAVVAALGIALLVPLYVSQRRDLLRLKEWMAAEPEHPAASLSASEAMLDRAETELEELEAVGAASSARTGLAPAAGLTAAARVTGDRPALERITLERAALAPHPRWRRFVAVATQTRVLAAVAAIATVAGVATIIASGELLGGEQEAREPGPGAIDPAEVDVAVLNGTAIPGLAARVSDDVRVSGFHLDTLSNSERQYDQTVVMYGPGQQHEARRVAHALGVQPLQPIDAATRQLAPDADVVVIAGEDRAGG